MINYKQSISHKFIKIVIPFILFISILTVLLLTSYQYIHISNQTKLDGQNLSKQYAKILVDPLWNIDFQQINVIAEALLTNNKVSYIKIYDETGKIILEKNKYISKKVFPFKASIYKQNKKIGEIEIALSYNFLIENISSNIKFAFFVLIVVIIFLIFLIFYLQEKYVYMPIKKLIEAMDRNKSSDSYFTVSEYSDDEIGYLTKEFNTMIENRRKSDDEIRSTKNYLNKVFDAMPSILINVNNDGIITRWNHSAELFFHKNANSMIGSKFWEQDEKLLAPLKKHFDKIINYPQEIFLSKFKIINEHTRFFDILLFPISNLGETSVVFQIKEITDIIKKDEQLRQIQKMDMIGTLAGGLAHDFNNAIGGIVGTVSLMKYNLLKSNDIDINQFKSHLDIIDNSAARATNMVKQLVTLSRKNEISLVPVNLHNAIKNIIKVAKNTFSKLITIKYERYWREAFVEADPTQIEQVLLNFFLNGAHAMTIMRAEDDLQGGNLTITLDKIEIDAKFTSIYPEAKEGLYWCIKISDEGVGIDSKNLRKIFDPFFTTKSKENGTGLGLSMVYSIIKQHNGFITVYSELNKGTTFSIYLPYLNEKQVIHQNSTKEEIPHGTETILIVDDEDLMRKMAEDVLKECGYKTMTAKNGFDAIEMYSSHKNEIDLVLLDMAMPKKDGRQTYRELKKINPNINVVLMSGFKEDSKVKETLKEGISNFIHKPFTMRELSLIIYKSLH